MQIRISPMSPEAEPKRLMSDLGKMLKYFMQEDQLELRQRVMSIGSWPYSEDRNTIMTKDSHCDEPYILQLLSHLSLCRYRCELSSTLKAEYWRLHATYVIRDK